MATERDVDSDPAAGAAAATTGGQSKRPALNHRSSDHSDTNNNTNNTSNNTAAAAPHQRQKHQKQRRVGGLHGRVPSNNKGLHKQHGNSSKVNLNRRQASPTESENQIPQRPPPPHRRATSEVKLTHNSSSSNVPKATSQSNLKRNRSHVEVGRRNKSSEKLNRSSSGSGINKLNKSSKTQVHFDLGSDDQEDEWVDASGSNSPYLSRKGSLNSSTHSSYKAGDSATNSAANSRPQTPSEPAQPESSSSERSTTQRKEYLTSRLLQRSASSTQVAPPKMSTDIAQAAPSHTSPVSTEHDTSPPAGSHDDGLTSRFVEVPGSGITSEGSFYNPARGGSHRSEILPRRPHSVINFSQSHEYSEIPHSVDDENSALVPKAAKRISVPAETSRTQQKLNLQRASSTIEPGQTVTGVVGVVGVSPLIGVGDAGHDGGNSRDPRVGKLLERHGMEYLVVRRHQNPIARSLNRLGRLPSIEKTKRIPRTNTGSTISSRRSVDLPVRHARNTSMPDNRGTVTPKRASSIRTNGAGSSFEGDDLNRLSERLSGASLVGDEEDSIAALLRNLWEKPMDLSASTD